MFEIMLIIGIVYNTLQVAFIISNLKLIGMLIRRWHGYKLYYTSLLVKNLPIRNRVSLRNLIFICHKK